MEAMIRVHTGAYGCVTGAEAAAGAAGRAGRGAEAAAGAAGRAGRGAEAAAGAAGRCWLRREKVRRAQEGTNSKGNIIALLGTI